MPNSHAIILYLVVIFTCYCMVILAIHDGPPLAVIHGACHCKIIFGSTPTCHYPGQHFGWIFQEIGIKNIFFGSLSYIFLEFLEKKVYFFNIFRIFPMLHYGQKSLIKFTKVYRTLPKYAKKSFTIILQLFWNYCQKCVTWHVTWRGKIRDVIITWHGKMLLQHDHVKNNSRHCKHIIARQ